MVLRAAINPDIIRERIIRVQAELRRLKVALRLAEAEARDRAKYFPKEAEKARLRNAG